MPPCFFSWSFCCGANLVLQTLGTLRSLTCAAVPRSFMGIATDPLLCLYDIVILSSSLNRVLDLNQGNCNPVYFPAHLESNGKHQELGWCKLEVTPLAPTELLLFEPGKAFLWALFPGVGTRMGRCFCRPQWRREDLLLPPGTSERQQLMPPYPAVHCGSRHSHSCQNPPDCSSGSACT